MCVYIYILIKQRIYLLTKEHCYKYCSLDTCYKISHTYFTQTKFELSLYSIYISIYVCIYVYISKLTSCGRGLESPPSSIPCFQFIKLLPYFNTKLLLFSTSLICHHFVDGGKKHRVISVRVILEIFKSCLAKL